MTPATTEPKGLSTLEIITSLAHSKDVDVAKFEALLRMQEHLEERQAKVSFERDFASASLEMPRVVKDGVKDMGEKGAIPFATYPALDKAVKSVEQKWGFTRSFRSKACTTGILMVCVLSHRDGHSVESERNLPPDPGPGRNALQAIGSSDSYARRYLTLGIWNIVTVGADDDGNKGGTQYMREDQVQHVYDLLTQCSMVTPATRKAFYNWAKVERVEDIQAHQYADVVAMLERKAKGK